MPSVSPYSRAFFDETQAGSSTAAKIVLEALHRVRPFRSLLDVGCGTGAWPAQARRLGAKQVLGLDGPQVPAECLRVPCADFRAADLEAPLPDVGHFDVTLCLELAEHLSPDRGPSLVADLVQTSDVVAFSAAIPFQGGDGHVNEMWHSYWAGLFAEHAYAPWTGLRTELWNDRRIPWWYRQNLIVYVARRRWSEIMGGAQSAPIETLNVVHPECYLWAARRAKADFQTSFEEDIQVYRRSVDGGPVTPPGYGPEFQAPEVYGRTKVRQP